MFDLSGPLQYRQQKKKQNEYTKHLKRSAAEAQQRSLKHQIQGVGPFSHVPLETVKSSPESSQNRATKACRAFFIMAPVSYLQHRILHQSRPGIRLHHTTITVSLQDADGNSHPTGKRNLCITCLAGHALHKERKTWSLDPRLDPTGLRTVFSVLSPPV